MDTTVDQLAEALRAVFDGTIRRELLALIAEGRTAVPSEETGKYRIPIHTGNTSGMYCLC